jgi:hypothetical protein
VRLERSIFIAIALICSRIISLIGLCTGLLYWIQGLNIILQKRTYATTRIGIVTGNAPRQAALKAANRGHTDIKLRERGTKKVHIFTGKRTEVKKPSVKKVGVEKLETL